MVGVEKVRQQSCCCSGRVNPQTVARIGVGIALILIVIAILAIAGHSSVVDAGVNSGVRSAGSVGDRIDTARRAAVSRVKTAATEAAEA